MADLPMSRRIVATGSPSTTRVVLELTRTYWVGTDGRPAARPPIHVLSAMLSKTAAKAFWRPRSGQVLTRIQLGRSRTDSPVQIRQAQPDNRRSLASPRPRRRRSDDRCTIESRARTRARHGVLSRGTVA